MKTATGKVIKAFRMHLNYKQDYVANKANITVQALSNIERGKVCLDIEKLYHISKIFFIPPKTILELAIEIFETETDLWLPNAVKAIKIIPSKINDDSNSSVI